jgi:hypothetical protein
VDTVKLKGDNTMKKDRQDVRSDKVSVAEYYESRRRFLIKVEEARRKTTEPEKKVNPLTLCPAEEY